jgi:hypothetical protein
MTPAVKSNPGATRRGRRVRENTAAGEARRSASLAAVLGAKFYAAAADEDIDLGLLVAHAAGIRDRRLAEICGYESGTGPWVRRRRTREQLLADGRAAEIPEASAAVSSPESAAAALAAAVEHRRRAENELTAAVAAAYSAGCYDREIAAVMGITAEAVRMRRLGRVGRSDIVRRARWTRAV